MADKPDVVSVELDQVTATQLKTLLSQDLAGLAALADACNNIDTRALVALADACNNIDTQGLAALADACNNIDARPLSTNLKDLSSHAPTIQKGLSGASEG